MDTKKNLLANSRVPTITLFNLGFRAFFLAAGIFSIITMALWAAIYFLHVPFPLHDISSSQWHAHEMIYGYCMAVIAGFLLTAVKNWTGMQTIYGTPLMLLFALWVTARLLFMLGSPYLFVAGIFDALFMLGLIVAVSTPIIKAKQWRQIAVLSKLILLSAGNISFYLGLSNLLDSGVYWGLYGGLYLVIGLILTVGRRVLPFFIERGVDYQVKLFNSKWIDGLSLVLFLGFFITELFLSNQALSSYLALSLLLIHSVRLIGWYTPGIWQKSLLWSIYLSFWFICIGFLLFAGIHFWGLSKFIAIHAFAYGGIGVITLGMMSRVALGHTGRDIKNPSVAIGYAFRLLLLGAAIRIFGPLFNSTNYVIWIGLSQAIWIISFFIFTVIYLPILSKPRVDGQFG